MLYSDITAFTFPSVHNNETEPGMSESKSQVSTSGNDLVCKYGATSATSKKNPHCFAKYARKLFQTRLKAKTHD